VLFSRDEVEKKVASLSGGEAARLLFARLGVEKPNVLVLDEPTNHLDLEAIEALVEALAAFDGTLLFVSHDRWFVSRLATRIVEITEHGLNDYHGSYDDYLAACGDDHLDSDQVVLRQRRPRPRSPDRRPPLRTPEERAAERRRRDLELKRDLATTAIEQAELRIEVIDRRFCEEGFFEATPAPSVRALQGEQQGLRAKVQELMAEWQAIESELAALSVNAESQPGQQPQRHKDTKTND